MRYLRRPNLKLAARRAGLLFGAIFFTGAARADYTLLSAFYTGGADWHLGSVGVGNIVGDNQLEIVVPYRDASGNWWLSAYDWSGNLLPGFPYSGGQNPINTSPTLYDLDGDGHDEIIFTCGSSVIALRGNGSVYWSNSVTRLNYIPNGGYMTVTNGFYWDATGAWIPNLPATATFFSEVSPPIVADFSGNGTKEVVTAWKIDPDNTSDNQDYNPFIKPIYGFADWGTVGEDWSGGAVFFNATTGAKTFVYHLHQNVEAGLGIGRGDTNKALNVYALNDSDSVVGFDKSKPFGLFGKGELWKQFGKNQRLMSGAYQKSVDVYTADIDGDGLSEVLVPTTQDQPLWEPNETILDDDGAILWRKWKSSVNLTNYHGWLNNACMIPCNPDHDNHADVLSFTHGYEIAYRYWNGVELVGHTNWPINFYPYIPTPPVVGDVDGDGEEEIIIGTYNPASVSSDGKLYIIGLNGVVKQAIDIPSGVKYIPALADVDRDGSLDVVVPALSGAIYVLNFGANSTNKVSWATHRGNMHRDGNYNVSLFPPGTPIITSKTPEFTRSAFTWAATTTNSPAGWRIYRADNPNGPFDLLLTLTPETSAFTDTGLKNGYQYFYEVGAVYPTNVVLSSPFVVTPMLNSNAIANPAFEENDNSHWDKWYTGDIDWTNMIGSTNVFFAGKQSMQIVLHSNVSNSSIKQFNTYGTPDSAVYVHTNVLYSFGAWFKSGGISQPSEHWIEWNSSPDGRDTNTRPSLPWPNYFTPHFVIGTTQTDWAYANRTFILPAGFPNIDFRHRFSITSAGSGSIFIDNATFRQMPAPTDTHWVSWIPMSSRWKYYTVAGVPPSDWYTPNFSEGLLWLSANAKFGAGSGPSGIVTHVTPDLPSYYFRQKFTVTDTNVEEMLLTAHCTDFQGGTGSPMRIFINGNEVPATSIEPGLDGNTDVYYDLTPFIGWVHLGTNQFAVQFNNTWQPTWDDVAFDVSLKVIPTTASATGAGHIVSIRPAANGINLTVDVPAGSIWSIQYNDAFPNPNWTSLLTFTNVTGGTMTITDTSARHPERMYQLRPR